MVRNGINATVLHFPDGSTREATACEQTLELCVQLERRREHADLVEKQRTTMRKLKETTLGVARARERAALVAETIRLRGESLESPRS